MRKWCWNFSHPSKRNQRRTSMPTIVLRSGFVIRQSDSDSWRIADFYLRFRNNAPIDASEKTKFGMTEKSKNEQIKRHDDRFLWYSGKHFPFFMFTGHPKVRPSSDNRRSFNCLLWTSQRTKTRFIDVSSGQCVGPFRFVCEDVLRNVWYSNFGTSVVHAHYRTLTFPKIESRSSKEQDLKV